MYTYARIKGHNDDLPQTFQKFVIKRDGEIVGKVSYDRSRWKSAGGPAWQLERGTSTRYGNKNFKESLQIFKKVLDK